MKEIWFCATEGDWMKVSNSETVKVFLCRET